MIYFLKKEKENEVKIGYTANIQRRIKQLERSTNSKLCLLLLTDGYISNEKRLHKHFKEYNIEKEWFRYEGKIIEYVESNEEYQIIQELLIKFNDRLSKAKDIFRFRIKRSFYLKYANTFDRLLGDRHNKVEIGMDSVLIEAWNKKEQK